MDPRVMAASIKAYRKANPNVGANWSWSVKHNVRECLAAQKENIEPSRKPSAAEGVETNSPRRPPQRA
jgi:hypothetical protein